MKAIVIGILPPEKILERVLSIARGEHKSKPGRPRIWFTSMRSLAEVLSDANRALLQVKETTNSQFIKSLAEATALCAGRCSRIPSIHVQAGISSIETEAAVGNVPK